MAACQTQPPLKLNLGCGEHYAPGWVNIDAFGGVRADVFANLDALPYPDSSAELVYAGHVLEHIHPDDLPAVLREVRRVLAPGGQFCAVGPDCDRIDPVREPDLYRMAGEGHDGIGLNPHAPHLWSCTEALLLTYVRRVFPTATAVLVAAVPEPWPVVARGEAWQCAILT